MHKITVGTRSRRYNVIVGRSIIARAGEWLLKMFHPGKVAVITDSTVRALHGRLLEDALVAAGLKPFFQVIPGGEQSKSLSTAGVLYGALNAMQAGRTTPVVAFGGGVTGDLAGFVAATYKRGLPLVQVPTTLLAQVDSSIGGKTAVDHADIKNNIGVFYQPSLVISDVDFLQILPVRELANGLAEVIKCAVIRDARLFGYLEKNMAAALDRDAGVLETIVARTAALKAQIVSRDENDTGLRNLLNFGHTIGHGIESASAYGISHGQAVAAGMLMATRIAVDLRMCQTESLDRLTLLLHKAGLPVDAAPPPIERIISAIEQDKKIRDGRLSLILPRKIGRAVISRNVTIEMIRTALESTHG